MKIETLIAAGQAAFGEHWITPMSKVLGVSDRTVRHWVVEKYKIPPTLYIDVQKILQSRILLIHAAMEMIKNEN